MTTNTLEAPAETGEPPPAPSARPDSVLRRHRLFLGATAAVMLHIADDNFLQPNPGVSPSDHLVSGLLPLALLGLGVWAYDRVRPGTRALIALTTGLTGLAVGAIESGSHLTTVGLRGDDFSGVLAVLAAFVLLWVAAVSAWRSRRADGSRVRRYARRMLKTAAVAIFVLDVVLPVGFGYMVTHVARAELQTAHLGRPYEDVTLTTEDGLHLKG